MWVRKEEAKSELSIPKVAQRCQKAAQQHVYNTLEMEYIESKRHFSSLADVEETR